jgi:membrane protein
VKKTLEAGRGAGLLFIVPLIWTGSLVFGAVPRALNVAFEMEQKYSLLKRVLVRLTMLLTLGVMFLLALRSSLLLRLLRFTLDVLPVGSEFVVQVAIKAVPAARLLLAFLLAYRFVPMQKPGRCAAFLGAVVATVVFLAAKPLFLGYVQTLATHNVFYGSLAGIVAAVIWAWVVAVIGLFGGQITSHCQSVILDCEPIENVTRSRSRKR